MIVLEILGGNLQQVYEVRAPNEKFDDNDVCLVDWDNIDAGDEAGVVPRILTNDLPAYLAAQIPGWTPGRA
ncbi:MAG: hypothetical protein WD904_10365 [Dehalococcoidia bacterium]